MLFRSNDTATTEIYTDYYTLSLHDALPIYRAVVRLGDPAAPVEVLVGPQLELVEVGLVVVAAHLQYAHLLASAGQLTGDHAAMRFGSPQPRSIHSRTCLAWSLAELGEFPAARAVGEEAVEIARSLDDPLSLVTAYFGIGYLLVRKGDLADALTILEPALEMTRAGHGPVWFPRIASLLGGLHSLAGRPQQGLRTSHHLRLVEQDPPH